ncbi:MAG: hypothetical protein IJD23_01280 [Spirochaetaceae bacterium]|nr:hypothetical protein [Spirochaetaceae bacterium]
MQHNITVPTGKVVGIGKLKVFASDDFPYIIPTLSFVVAKTENKEYTASCMQLLLDGAADNEKDAVERLNESCKLFLQNLFKYLSHESAWEQLHELLNDNASQEYWMAYRNVQLNLAESGIDLKFEREKFYEERIQELQRQIDKLKEIPDQFQVEVVSYQSFGDIVA